MLRLVLLVLSLLAPDPTGQAKIGGNLDPDGLNAPPGEWGGGLDPDGLTTQPPGEIGGGLDPDG